MSLPVGHNGTKFGSLALCSHIYKNIITDKVSKEEFKKRYCRTLACWMRSEDIDYFFKHFSPKKFNKCFYAESVGQRNIFNQYLKSIGSPIGFKRSCRTGYAVCLQKIIEGKNKVFVSHFSILKNEPRHSWYIQKGKSKSPCHDDDSEISVLRWLHQNNKIDASLCLLKDSDNIEFEDDELKPSQYIQGLLNKIYEK